MTKKTLRQLYAEHGGKISDKWSLYLAVYDLLFDKYRDEPVRFLEIGIQNGSSLEIWSKYFSNAVTLIGCDINRDCARLSFDDPRIGVVIGDANASDVREQVFQRSPQFDIVINGGSNLSSDIIKSFALYFPHIVEGGVFVAEDQLCSYRNKFEDGLYDPYSAISFFKQLTDIINHEHWGIPKARAGILSGILSEHGCTVDEEALSQVHSVEFINSMCVVRKALTSRNSIEKSLIVGSLDLAIPGLEDNEPEPYSTLDQSNNFWTARTTPPDEAIQQPEVALVKTQEQNAALEQQNSALKQRNSELSKEIVSLHNSTSWRITHPLRIVGRQIKRVRRVAELTMSAVKRGGGFKNTFRKAIQLFRRDGLAGIKRGFRMLATAGQNIPSLGSNGFGRNDYIEWIRRYDTLTDVSRANMRACIDAFSHKPLISVVMPVYNAPISFLDEAIQSVRDQLYPNWELCIADDASTDRAVRELLEQHCKQEHRIKVVYREKNGHISRASNSALELAQGEFIALFDHDDVLAEHALYWIVDAINRHPDVGVVYSDEDKIDGANRRYDPYFKCDLNYELLLAQNMISHLGVYRTDIVRSLGGFRVGFEGSQDYDLILRVMEKLNLKQIVHVPHVLYHWRAIAGSTALAAGEKSYASEAGRKAVAEHLKRTGLDAEVMPAPEAPGFNRVRFACPSPQPLVSIVIPTRDRADLLGMCLDSLIERTTYVNYEVIIVDNGSVEEATQQLFTRLPKDRFKILRDESPFNFSALNNNAARMARGELLCFMNNDIEILTPDWLDEMVSFAMRPEIGCVGARLWYPDGGLQHGGVLLGVGGVGNHAHYKIERGNAGYFGRAILHQSFSAVTGACLLVRRSIYQEVDGLDEQLVVAFNDVDFCLRVREAGYRNVWTPYAEMNHHESASRGSEDTPAKQARFSSEIRFIQARWGKQLSNDPAYSPNLTIHCEDFSYAWPPRTESTC